MSYPLASAVIADAYRDACFAEVRALKPGNVHVYAEGHGMAVIDFERSAEATAEVIADTGFGVGERIHRAVVATFDTVGCNTNLGILLLCGPLAKAAAAADTGHAPDDLAERLTRTLDGLDHHDAAHIFAAIARASPGGLGEADTYDVTDPAPPDMSLADAMRAAAHRDLIAEAYATGFRRVFELARAIGRHAAERTETEAVTLAFLDMLATTPDTHIARKHGIAAAQAVSQSVQIFRQAHATALAACPFSSAAMKALLDLDATLKAGRLNPGSLADLTAAALFVRRLSTAAGTHV